MNAPSTTDRDCEECGGTGGFLLGMGGRGGISPCEACKGSGKVASQTVQEVSKAHAEAAGSLCVDGGDGCCLECGVSLCVCEDCGGNGYHKTDCPYIARCGEGSPY